MNKVAKKLNTNVGGVPFTVIGNKFYSGFSEEIGKQMLEQVKSLFEDQNRYDIKNDIDLTTGKAIGENKGNGAATFLLLAVILVGGIVLIYIVGKSK